MLTTYVLSPALWHSLQAQLASMTDRRPYAVLLVRPTADGKTYVEGCMGEYRSLSYCYFV